MKSSIDKLRRQSIEESNLTKLLLSNPIENKIKELDEVTHMILLDADVTQEINNLRERARNVEAQVSKMNSESEKISKLVDALSRFTVTTKKATADSNSKICVSI